MSDPFANLPRGHYGAILADPPWHYETWSDRGGSKSAKVHYTTMTCNEIIDIPLGELAADNSVLFLWTCWWALPATLKAIDGWGFKYKTCAFSWMKGDPYRLFADDVTPDMGIHERIERLVAGPYCELFARQTRPNWDCWGNEIEKFKEARP
jgi:N6-adenosine-specific RNA methylase IME4